MATATTAKTATTATKTYFIRFDGYSFHIDYIFPNKDLEKVFNKLFDEEKGWTHLQELFEYEFDKVDDGSGVTCILGCPIPSSVNESRDSYDYLAAFVKYYVEKGYLEFFADVDRTWADPVESDGPAYSFVNDLDKMLTIMKNCISGEGNEDETILIESEFTEQLKPSKYYQRKSAKKRKLEK